jgi:HEAT repeat protein
MNTPKNPLHVLAMAAVAAAFIATVGCALWSCATGPTGSAGRPSMHASGDGAERMAHLDLVQRSDFCARCHPDAAAEHRMNTHGRAFSDPEVRMATAQFSIAGCIDCHTPRPVFETGIGKNPVKRLHHLEEANSCMTCHAKGGFDYATFQGGARECKDAFDGRVGQVEACASCHRNHGTPYQWEHAKFGKQAGNTCVDCHMPEVTRPVAAGGPAKKTRRHTFFASRSESQLAMAYEYRVKLDGNEFVATITNAGAGHNFPTELKQRAVESLVIIRDVAGREIARSRQIYRDPYKRPYGLNLPVNTQIPSGETREHRVPVPVSAGTIESQLFYKLYYPIEDSHPDLSRILESRSLAFGPIEPSSRPIQSMPEIQAHLPEAMPAESASPGNLADFARPKIDKVHVDIPDGIAPGDAEKLVALFQFPVPEANKKAQDALVKMGDRALPALVAALGSWDNKTWMQAQQALVRIGVPAVRALAEALAEGSDLYINIHALEILPRLDRAAVAAAGVAQSMRSKLKSGRPLERAYAADALGRMGAKDAAPDIRELLNSGDFDVIAAGARALAALGDRDSVESLKSTLRRVRATAETSRDVAWAMAALGSADGARYLMDRLDYPDDLVRVSMFEAFLDVTGLSAGYTPNLAYDERMTALANLRWEFERRGKDALRASRMLQIPGAVRAEVATLTRDAGGNDVAAPNADVTEKAIARLIEIGKPAVPQIIDALKWPAGFIDKRVAMLRVLVAVPDADALAALIDAAADPTLTTSLWAARAIESLGDAHAAPALAKLVKRFDEAAAANRLPASLGHPEDARVMLGRARAKLGDDEGARLLLRLLFSIEPSARAGAESALAELYGSSATNPATKDRPVAAEVRATLENLAELRANQVAGMRAAWSKLADEADAAAENAVTKEQMLSALVRYDFAEEAATRYVALDPRGFAIDFGRTTRGADELSNRLSENTAWRDSIAARDLHALVERRGFAQSSSGVHVTFDPARIVMEAPEGPGGSLSFGIGGAGGLTVPLEWWRDYEVTFDLTIERGELWILDRYDPIWAIYAQTALSAVAPEVSGVLHAAIAIGKSTHIQHTVVGNTVTNRAQAHGEAADEVSAATPMKVRKGGIVFQVPGNSRVVIENLKLKVFRTDAAETVNAMMATPGR